MLLCAKCSSDINIFSEVKYTKNVQSMFREKKKNATTDLIDSSISFSFHEIGICAYEKSKKKQQKI